MDKTESAITLPAIQQLTQVAHEALSSEVTVMLKAAPMVVAKEQCQEVLKGFITLED